MSFVPIMHTSWSEDEIVLRDMYRGNIAEYEGAHIIVVREDSTTVYCGQIEAST